MMIRSLHMAGAFSFSLLPSLPTWPSHHNLAYKRRTRACSSYGLCSTQEAPAVHDDGVQKGYADDDKHALEEKHMKNERGVPFLVGGSFYREESAVGRDLGVLAAAIYKKKKGQLHVLDALCGSGVRAARYLAQAQADFVWANDACDHLEPLISHNLALASTTAAITQSSTIPASDGSVVAGRNESLDLSEGASSLPDVQDLKVPRRERWKVTIEDANRVLLDCYMRKNYYDLIDVDSFGSNSVFLGSALSAVSFGGLVYVTSTDGFCAGGHRPFNSLASYGSYIRPMNYANELGLRMLIGGVVREAALRDMHVYPVFSHYSFHGPVFRAMLRVYPSKIHQTKHYNFVAYCNICGETQVVQWNALGRIKCSCSSNQEVSSMTVSGPLWTGPLHDVNDVKEMIEMAKCWGWIERDPEACENNIRRPADSAENRKFKELLEIMLEESHPDLQVGYIELDQISKRGKLSRTPRRTHLIAALHQEGYEASQSHVEPNAVKTNCSVSRCVEIARSLTSQPSAS